jgi:hypothetical protein
MGISLVTTADGVSGLCSYSSPRYLKLIVISTALAQESIPNPISEFSIHSSRARNLISKENTSENGFPSSRVLQAKLFMTRMTEKWERRLRKLDTLRELWTIRRVATGVLQGIRKVLDEVLLDFIYTKEDFGGFQMLGVSQHLS